MGRYRCKFIAGDGCYQYLYFDDKPHQNVRFPIRKPIASAERTRIATVEYRDYQFKGKQGQTLVYREI